MSLSQFQIIQSLGKSLEWFQTEMSWGSSAQELRHLTGRIGELYTAMVTYGQMAPENNQRGYDVVSSKGERISVKTITSSSHVSFRKSTLEFIDRVMILRINVTDLEIDILVNERLEDLIPMMREDVSTYIYPINNNGGTARNNDPIDFNKIEIVNEVQYGAYTIKQYENGSIIVINHEGQSVMAKPVLREFAKELNVSLLNSAGAQKNTRQLGDHIIKTINEKSSG